MMHSPQTHETGVVLARAGIADPRQRPTLASGSRQNDATERRGPRGRHRAPIGASGVGGPGSVALQIDGSRVLQAPRLTHRSPYRTPAAPSPTHVPWLVMRPGNHERKVRVALRRREFLPTATVVWLSRFVLCSKGRPDRYDVAACKVSGADGYDRSRVAATPSDSAHASPDLIAQRVDVGAGRPRASSGRAMARGRCLRRSRGRFGSCCRQGR
jgi:hypothetical protein